MTPSIASRAMQRDYPDHRCPSEPERIGDPRQGWHGFSNGDGHEAAILNATYLEPACGCRVVGAGTLQHPIMVEPCEAHAAAMYPTLAEPTDALDRIDAGLSVSYGELAEVDPARCPSSPDRRGPHRPDDTTDPLTCAECGAVIPPPTHGTYDPDDDATKTPERGYGTLTPEEAAFMESARPRWALNAGREVTFDGRPVFLVTRAVYGEDYGEDYDLTPPATLDRLTRDIVAALNAGGIEA